MTALTRSAARSRMPRLDQFDGVATFEGLASVGIGWDEAAAHLAAGRWTCHGYALLLHNGEPTRAQREQLALINCGPRSVLTSFTCGERMGLRGWERPDVHVLAPAGTTNPHRDGVTLHRTGDWSKADLIVARRLHRLAPALVIAASSFDSPRPACGILAAAVQQRLVRPWELRAAVQAASRTRHRHALLLAVDDIEGGAQALSEIDFARMCRRARLPEPRRQVVRLDEAGRRRYLDALWERPDGSVFGVEVDGALHLAASHWWHDMLRQNELTIAGTPMLRFPTVVVRHEPALVVDQVQRMLIR
ncbi:MAG: hypothetical protein ACTHMS_00685 [Jatrophihabitans sp.]|uniref:hypothetical protein n=1 Tax=Jatrophihabitans sp. TaxID=1932789 RepID=UPI003F7F387B